MVLVCALESRTRTRTLTRTRTVGFGVLGDDDDLGYVVSTLNILCGAVFVSVKISAFVRGFTGPNWL